MPPNKSRQPRKPRERKTSTPKVEDKPTPEKDEEGQEQQQQRPQPISAATAAAVLEERTGNEESNKDIFIDIEPKRSTNLVVTEHVSATPVIRQEPVDQQQVTPVKNSDHNIILIQQENQHEQQNEHQEQANHRDESNQENQNSDWPEYVWHRTNSPSTLSLDDDVFDEAAMSDTLTKLTTPNGSEIYLVGTAHFSLKSVQDVRKVIRSTKPTSVILELCRERAFMLTLDEEYLFEQNSTLTFQKIRRAIAEKGLVQGLIFVLFIKMSASLTEKLGMAPGAEFRAGSAEAQKVPGCNVVLADRSLRTTIARAVAALTMWQKMKLTYMVLKSDLSITQEEVEKCKDRDILEQLMLEMGGQFPGFKRVLLDERDIYLSHSIFKWAQNYETSLGPPRIVAIMGIGHVPGIVANWGKTTDEQIRSLNVVPETSRTELVVRKSVKYGIIALVVYVGYCCLAPSSFQASVSRKVFGGGSS